MTKIDWWHSQGCLLGAGYNPGSIDGRAGRMTYTALFAHQAQRQPDATLRALGAAAAAAFPLYGVDASAQRLSEFLGETGNETGGYTRFEENLHYSAKRLMQVWPSRFKTLAQAAPYAWDPSDPDQEDVALANMVYGGRMGNQANGTGDNDGWDHRGGGLIQHTGANEYQVIKQRLGYTTEDVHTDLAKMVYAACDFFLRARMFEAVDEGNFKESRRRANGGYIGLDNVTKLRLRSFAVLNC